MKTFSRMAIHIMIVISISVSGAIWAAPLFEDAPLCCTNADECNPPVIEFRGGQGDFFDEGDKKCCDHLPNEADCSANKKRYCRASCGS